MGNNRRITVKIGSNVLARPDGMLDVTRMSALVDQICTLREAGIEVIVITSGAVACGRSELRHLETGRLDKVSSRQLFSAVGQVKLINRYYDLFRDHGVAVGQVLTMKENFATRRHYLNQRNCMEVMMASGIVPIINENDTVSVTELMFTDNDELSGLVAAMMGCDTLVILSNIDGIYNGDPKAPGSKVIAEVAPADDLDAYIQTARSGLGRGGMATKYRISRKVADEGIEVVIANGKREDILPALMGLTGEKPVATRFLPSAAGASSMKRWLAHSDGFAKGVVRVSRQAVEAVTSGGAVSLLPIGVVAVEGDFEKDDLVGIVADDDGSQVGIGRVTCDSSRARADIGRHGCRPLIHYDYLYIE